jgi:hypothetical protein
MMASLQELVFTVSTIQDKDGHDNYLLQYNSIRVTSKRNKPHANKSAQ